MVKPETKKNTKPYIRWSTPIIFKNEKIAAGGMDLTKKTKEPAVK